MENNQDELRRANRKALPKFIALLVLGGAIGFAVGFLAVKEGFGGVTEALRTAGAFFSVNIAPWLLLAAAVLFPIVCCTLLSRAKRLLADWDGEDEAVSDRADAQLSLVVWVSGSFLIVSYILIAAVYSRGFDGLGGWRLATFGAAVAAFLAVFVEVIVFQKKAMDLSGRLYPEKNVSVFDSRFQKKWLDSCDEAEKIQIGRAAFKAYNATNSVCSVLAAVLAIGALVLGTGFLPAGTVCAVWLVNQTAYCREAMRLGKAGNHIS